MKVIYSIAVISLLLSGITIASASREAIAIFPNNPGGWAKEGRRVEDIFSKNNIIWSGGGSRGFSVNVDSLDADKARYYLAGAIVIEKLEITLAKPNPEKTKWINVTPYEALHSYKPVKAEQGTAANP